MTRGRPELAVKSEADVLDAEMNAHRAGTYELLARLFAREPDVELIEALRSIEVVDTGAGPLAMGWELLRRAGESASEAAVRREYNALFIGLGRGEIVPFGSWYITGFLMEKPLAVLRADLQALGIDRRDGVVESEDHIAALCDAMALIIRHPDEIRFSGQRRFFDDHLSSWVLRLFDDLQAARAAHFYRSVGFFGRSFFEFEQRLLSMQR